MKAKINILGFMILVLLLTQTGCSNKSDGNDIPSEGNSSESTSDTLPESTSEVTPTPIPEVIIDDAAVMDEYEVLTSTEDIKLVDVISYIEKNVSAVTVENASLMLLRLEELQIANLAKLEETYYPETVQIAFQETNLAKLNYNLQDSFQDAALQALVKDTKESGYKIDQAEGFYYPVIDYSIYKNYSSYATPDITKYLDIMAVESDQAFAKDAALVIGWDEVINRTLSLEEFMKSYVNSVKLDTIKDLYLRYEFIAMYGLNNTPLFDYDTKVLNQEAKIAYETILAGDSNSEFFIKLKSFMDVVEKNGFKLTKEVEQYREDNTESLTATDSDSESNRYYVAGIDDVAEFEESFQLIQDLVEKDNRTVFAEYIVYPINVIMNGEKTVIENENEFVENYDKIMTEPVKNALLNQKVDETFVNWMGVMVGQGEIWINMISDQKHKYSINAINN